MSDKAWGGRFEEELNDVALRYSASVDVDSRLAPQDIRGSIAHVQMLAAQGIVPQADTLDPDFSVAEDDSRLDSAFGSEMDRPAEPEISSSEEVATKIDLAKAYQEMGDLEGARELLQEVLKDGDAAQREAAQAILGELRE